MGIEGSPKKTAIFCYASEDAAVADDLARYLELNTPLTASWDGLIQDGRDLLDAVEWGLSTDLVLILLSPDSVPKAWVRERWAPILLDRPRDFQTPIGFVLLRDCKFPELLRKQKFFDLSRDRRAGQRALRRWIWEKFPSLQSNVDLPAPYSAARPPVEVLEGLERRLVDKPGIETRLSPEIALAFADTHLPDFEGVFWIDCANRSRAGLLGHTAHTLGLRLRGTVEQNARDLRDFCAGRRCLFIFEGIADEDKEPVSFGGSASLIFTATGRASSPALSLEQTTAVFHSWMHNPESCLDTLRDAQRYLSDFQSGDEESWQTFISLGRAVVAVLGHYERLAEADEVLQFMAAAARAQGDPLTAHRLEWERSWILEEWGQGMHPPPRIISPSSPAQLILEFSAT